MDLTNEEKEICSALEIPEEQYQQDKGWYQRMTKRYSDEEITSDWIWMPCPGHFCAANECRFFLCTYVNNHIISTVGEYCPAYLDNEVYQDLGPLPDSKYEVSVWKAVDSDMDCCPKIANIDEGEEWMERFKTREEAFQKHIKLCYCAGGKKSKSRTVSISKDIKDKADQYMQEHTERHKHRGNLQKSGMDFLINNMLGNMLDLKKGYNE